MENPEKLYGALFYEQLELEDTYKNLAEAILYQTMATQKSGQEAITTLPLGRKLLNYKLADVFDNVKAFVRETLVRRRGVKPRYRDYVEKLMDIYKDQEDQLYGMLAALPLSILIDRTMGGAKGSTIYSNILHEVANELEQESKIAAYLQTLSGGEFKSVLKGMSERYERAYKAYYAERRMKHSGFQWSNWDRKDAAQLAGILVQIVIDTTNYFEEYRSTSKGKDNPLMIQPTEWLLATWAKNEGNMVTRAFRLCPTIIPPAPWERINVEGRVNGLQDIFEGGYYGRLRKSRALLRHDSLIHPQQSDMRTKHYLSHLEGLDLTDILKAINILQETPWTINKEVLAVIQEIVLAGGDRAGIPQMEPLAQLPDLTGEFTEEQLKAHRKKKWQIYKKDITRATLAGRSLAALKTAETFSKYDRIYFPHNMDFRGRIYPMPVFSPQGDDITKGLLLFADPPACESMVDIEWLMVHGANLAGIDKVSFDDRKQWVRDNEQRILMSAADPLGYLWWAEQDDSSMQFLAFCFEWAKWKAWEKTHGGPQGFTTGIPVAFDGTCSGLQHYSALLRDPIGGAAVNLVPDDHPHDIYKEVANKVNEILEHDAIHGTPDENRETEEGKAYIKYGTKSLAQQWLVYGVTRKVTKRSVMTTPYGSREYGFRDQILEDTIEPAIKEGRGGMFIAPAQAAGYMAKLIWNGVQQVVVKAVQGMDWLEEMAKLVCNDGMAVEWQTPMGLTVRQPYTETTTEEINLHLRRKVQRHFYDTKPTGEIKKSKQITALAPNFIHSMDAAHLQLTTLMAREAGIDHFAMIHDSFGAPVPQAKIMFKIVREAFYRMYNETDVLDNFTKFLWVKAPPLPERGKLNLEEVKNSLYMFA
jgi:DNA-directed RNA polymerase